ncbi:MAG: outer membrane beta-barrel protein [Pseudomonadales bacterium]|nr:outer membrane beta-barrel protein [Pseudomonadales bacterium]
MKKYINSKYISSICAVVFLGISSISYAEGGFLGVQYGTLSSEDADMGNLGLVGGATITDNFSIEGQYTLTINEEDLGGGDSLETNSLGLYATYKSVGNTYFKGRVGFARLEYDLDIVGGTLSGDTTGLSYGVGLGIVSGESLVFEFEYTVYPELDEFDGAPAPDLDGNLASVGILFKI